MNTRNLKIKGVMLDPARVCDRHDLYKEKIRDFARWGFNTLFWHFCDDNACRLVFPSRPELASPFAFTPGEMRELIAYAGEHGISVVPEVECLGHTGYIYRQPLYRHLKDGMPGKFFASISPCAAETRQILRDLLADTAEVFDSPYIHVGMDEAAFGEHPDTAKALKSRAKHEIYAEHVQWLHETVSSFGKTMMMWGDHLRPEADSDMDANLDHEAVSEKIAEAIPRDIVICDWYYKQDVPDDRLKPFLEKGFRVLACPALVAYGDFAHSAEWNLVNIEKMIALAHRENTEGAVTTVWETGRQFYGCSQFGMAYAAALINGWSAGREAFARRFAADYFGLCKPDEVADAILTLHRTSCSQFIIRQAVPVTAADARPLTPDEEQAVVRMGAGGGRARALLQKNRPDVAAHAGDYDDLLLTAEIVEHLAARYQKIKAILPKAAAGSALTEPEKAVLRQALAEAETIHAKAEKAWDRTRYPEDIEKFGPPGCNCGYLVQRLHHSFRFMEEMLT